LQKKTKSPEKMRKGTAVEKWGVKEREGRGKKTRKRETEKAPRGEKEKEKDKGVEKIWVESRRGVC